MSQAPYGCIELMSLFCVIDYLCHHNTLIDLSMAKQTLSVSKYFHLSILIILSNVYQVVQYRSLDHSLLHITTADKGRLVSLCSLHGHGGYTVDYMNNMKVQMHV